jgi:hypothetical protein
MYGAGGQTPFYGGAGSQTPFYGGGADSGAAGAAAGGRTPMYGAAGGRTPMYGAAGGRTPMYGAGGVTPMYGAGGAAEAAAAASAQTARQEADGIARTMELAVDATWATSGVRVEMVAGQYKGKSGSLKKVYEAGASPQGHQAQVVLSTGSTVQIPLRDLRPVRPTAVGCNVLVLGGDRAGQRGELSNMTVEEGYAFEEWDLVVSFAAAGSGGESSIDVLNGTAVVVFD